MTKDKNWKQYLNDGLHLSELGNKLVFDLIFDILKKKFYV